MSDTSIATQIRQRMDAIGTNQNRVAAEAGLNLTYVRDILKGRSKHPGHERLQMIFEALDRLEALSDTVNPHLEAERLEAARKAAWADIDEAADALDVEPEWLLSVEAGQGSLEDTFILKFCAEARCPPGWIQRGDMTGMMPEMSARIAYSHPHLLRDILKGRGREGER